MHRGLFQAAAAGLLGGIGFGCGDARLESVSPAKPAEVATAFDATTAGSISGRVLWEGAVPAPDLLDMRTDPPVARGKTCLNPNFPQINPASKAVGGAIVFLRGVEPRKARPWNHAPVRVEMRDLALHVHQGDVSGNVGFVRAGDEVALVSRDSVFHALEARGAAFFSLRFVDAQRPSRRRLDTKGVVDLKSAAGYYWMRAYLLVDDHPYYARTDKEGRFRLEQVPPGEYRLVCWMPNYRIVRRERDPENGLVTRLAYGPPLELQSSVRTESGEARTIDFTVSADAFGPSPSLGDGPAPLPTSRRPVPKGRAWVTSAPWNSKQVLVTVPFDRADLDKAMRKSA